MLESGGERAVARATDDLAQCWGERPEALSGTRARPWRTLTRREFVGIAAAFAGETCLAGCDVHDSRSDTLSAARRQSAAIEPVGAAANAAAASHAFPLRVSANGRYLIQPDGMPFPLLGRSAWFVLTLSTADYEAFLDDTVAKGFTAIEFHVINHDPRGDKPPFANVGTLLPFAAQLDGQRWNAWRRSVPDFTRINEPYWQFVDRFLAACASRHLVALVFPAYTGYRDTCDGWMTEMLLNGPERMRAYGAFVARRYAAFGNIIWMLGGDDGTGTHRFTPAQSSVEQALIAGMKSVEGQLSVQFAAEWSSESIGTDQADLQQYLTLNGAYSHAGLTATQARRAYTDATRTMPAFLLEGAYDEEGPPDGARWPGGKYYYNDAATPPVRRFTWRGWLSGIAGYVDGNGFVWPFRSGWKAHLDTQGARDLARLNGFIRSIEWHTLVPDGLGPDGTRIVTQGAGTIDADDHIAAAATPDGSLLIAYFSPAHASSATIDTTRMRSTAVGRWFDPTSASYTPIGEVPNTSARVFTPPGRNSAGDGDWVLRLDA